MIASRIALTEATVRHPEWLNCAVIALTCPCGCMRLRRRRRRGVVMSSQTASALALLEASSPRTSSQRISLVAAADAGIANDRPEVLVE